MSRYNGDAAVQDLARSLTPDHQPIAIDTSVRTADLTIDGSATPTRVSVAVQALPD